MVKQVEKDIWRRINKVAGIMVAFSALVMVIYHFIPKVHQYNEYQATVDALTLDINALQDQITEMQTKRRNFQGNKDYARRVAHEHGFSEAGEVIYRFLDEPSN